MPATMAAGARPVDPVQSTCSMHPHPDGDELIAVGETSHAVGGWQVAHRGVWRPIETMPAAHRDLDPREPDVAGHAAAAAGQPLPPEPPVPGVQGARPGDPHHHAAALPVRAAAAGADHPGHPPERGLPRLRRLADVRRQAHRPQRPRLPGEGHQIQRAAALDITDAANDIAAEGKAPIQATWRPSPYIIHTVRRFGNWALNLTPPDDVPNTRLDLEPRVLFAAAPA